MKLYIHPGSPNARRARAVARHLGLAVEEVVLDMRAGAQRAAEYLALNPNGKVPTLVDGDRVLWESNAIGHYFAALRPASGLFPADSVGQMNVLRWQFWEGAHLGPATGKLVFQHLFTGGKPDAAVVDQALVEYGRFAGVLDAQLRGGAFVVGDALTLADFSLAAAFSFRGPAQIPTAPYPGISAWLDRMDALPAWRDTAP